MSDTGELRERLIRLRDDGRICGTLSREDMDTLAEAVNELARLDQLRVERDEARAEITKAEEQLTASYVAASTRAETAEEKLRRVREELLPAQAEATHGATANARFIDGCVDRALSLLDQSTDEGEG